MKLEMNKSYEADIELGWVESMAGNGTIEDKLREAGFSDVTVSGSGSDR